MNVFEEASKRVNEIEDAIAEYKTENPSEPKYLILDLSYRTALKFIYPGYSGTLDPRAFLGIKIIKKEEVIIL